jgi:hypothetical protein
VIIKIKSFVFFSDGIFSSPFFKSPAFGDDIAAEESVESPAFPSEIHPGNPGSFSALGSMLDGRSPFF